MKKYLKHYVVAAFLAATSMSSMADISPRTLREVKAQHDQLRREAQAHKTTPAKFSADRQEARRAFYAKLRDVQKRQDVLELQRLRDLQRMDVVQYRKMRAEDVKARRIQMAARR